MLVEISASSSAYSLPACSDFQNVLGDPAGDAGLESRGMMMANSSPLSRHHLAIVEHAGNPRRDRLQHLVAVGVPEQVVDLLEPVEVEAQDGERPPDARRISISWSSFLLKLLRLGSPVRASWCARKRMCCSASLRARRSRTAMASCGLPPKSTGRRMSSTGDHRAVRAMQVALDRPGSADPSSFRRVPSFGNERFERARRSSCRPAAPTSAAKLSLTVTIGLAIANQEPFDRGIGETAHPVDFELTRAAGRAYRARGRRRRGG